MSAIAAVQVRKELRELLPWWIGTLAALLVGGWLARTRSGIFHAIPVLAYCAGSLGLGAVSVGHEYVHRTLGALLAQPIDRRSILAIKLLTLTPLLLSLGGIALWVFDSSDLLPRQVPPSFWVFALMPVITGFFLTQWLTMICRGPFAGAVFSIALLGLLLLVSSIFKYNVKDVLVAVLGLNFVAGVLGWRTFMRLQAIDGPHAEIDLTGLLRWRRTAVEDDTVVGASRTWLIIKKEVQLQHVTFVLAGIYIVIWIAVSILNKSASQFSADLYGVSTIFAWVIAVVAGCVASAEERNLNTAQWQTLLPMSSRSQWAIKAVIAIVVAVVLGVGLPVLLHRRLDDWHFGERTYGISALAIVGLYVSSFSPSGMRAILACFPIFAAAGFVFTSLLMPLGRHAEQWFHQLAPAVARVVQINRYPLVIDRVWVVSVTIGLAALLYFGLRNHRVADSPVRRLLSQVATLVAGAAAAVLLNAFLYSMYWARLSR